MTIRLMYSVALVMGAAFLSAGCGGGEGKPTKADAGGGEGASGGGAAEAGGGSVTDAMKAFKDGGPVVELTIEGNDTMKYDKTEFSVEPGQMVRLTLEHVGNLPAAAMGHNVVIIQRGEDYMEFTADANEQGANQSNHYLPEAVRDRVIAFTEMVGGGESTTVEFKAPDEPGEYPYLCTFPGHAIQMNGTMQVEQ